MSDYMIENGWLMMNDSKCAVRLDHISTVVVGAIPSDAMYWRNGGYHESPTNWQVVVRNGLNTDIAQVTFWAGQYDSEDDCETAAKAYHLELVRDIARALR